jgi:hypothetical protein
MAFTGRLAAAAPADPSSPPCRGVADAVGLLFVTGPAQSGDPPANEPPQEGVSSPAAPGHAPGPIRGQVRGGTEYSQEAVLAQANRMEAEGRPPGAAGPNTPLPRVNERRPGTVKPLSELHRRASPAVTPTVRSSAHKHSNGAWIGNRESRKELADISAPAIATSPFLTLTDPGIRRHACLRGDHGQ